METIGFEPIIYKCKLYVLPKSLKLYPQELKNLTYLKIWFNINIKPFFL